MCRLIEIQPAGHALPPDLTVRVGDVLRFAASGGRVRDGAAIDILGTFVEGVLGTNGRILTPEGPPTTILFHARAPGQAVIDIVVGDPYRGPTTWSMTIIVRP